MEGTTTDRILHAARAMLSRPRDATCWLGGRFVPRNAMAQRLPWMSYAAIEYLKKHVEPGHRVFEWGGGGSTLFFLERGCHVTTAESSPEWAHKIFAQADVIGAADRLDLRTFDVAKKRNKIVDDYIKTISDGGPWDIIVIDGEDTHYNKTDAYQLTRTQCARAIGDNIKEGGMVVLDDAWRPEYAGIAGFLDAKAHLRFESLGPDRLGVTRTDIFRF